MGTVLMPGFCLRRPAVRHSLPVSFTMGTFPVRGVAPYLLAYFYLFLLSNRKIPLFNGIYKHCDKNGRSNGYGIIIV